MKTQYNKFDSGLKTELKNSIEQFFPNIEDKYGGKEIIYKMCIFFGLLIANYNFILIKPIDNIYIWYISWGFQGIIFALIGFNVMHDASHKTFSSISWLNTLMAHSLTLMGASIRLWIIKHVFVHHSKTNSIDDDDINTWPFMRSHPDQKLLWFHKYQHIYAPILYCTLYFLWVHVNDFIKYFSNKVKNFKIKKNDFTQSDKIPFWLGKIFHVIIFYIIPASKFGWLNAFWGYLIMSAICGLIISIVFQLAHVVENTKMQTADNDGNLEDSFIKSQILTTCDFATNSKLISYLLGGLNFQIEHHLFPNISHVHYPKIQPVIKQTILNSDLPYNELTFWGAIKSHFKRLKQLGRIPNIALS